MTRLWIFVDLVIDGYGFLLTYLIFVGADYLE